MGTSIKLSPQWLMLCEHTKCEMLNLAQPWGGFWNQEAQVSNQDEFQIF